MLQQHVQQHLAAQGIHLPPGALVNNGQDGGGVQQNFNIPNHLMLHHQQNLQLQQQNNNDDNNIEMADAGGANDMEDDVPLHNGNPIAAVLGFENHPPLNDNEDIADAVEDGEQNQEIINDEEIQQNIDN